MKTPQEKIQEKIQEILDKCSKGNYIFRGENKKYEKVSSGLYRQYCQRDDSKPNDSNPVIDNEHFFVSSIEQNIIEGVKKHFRLGALNIEVLTKLQHYGGKTALLDFSKDLHIALFFACDGNFDQNGRVIFFERSELTESEKIDYDQSDKAKHTLISPTGKSPRVIFQSSIFVHVPRGYLEKSRYETIEIEKELKKPILDYLRQYFDIKTETVYNDIQGFIRNQHNHPAAEIEFYRGLTNYNSGEHEKTIKNDDKVTEYYNKAIENYTKSIKLNPQNANAYNNRGLAKHALEKHQEAIADYNKAIELNPKDAVAYNNRGFTNYALGEHKAVIADFSKAIELDSKYAMAYYNRGLANHYLENYKAAIADYNKAIEFNSQFSGAYNNRGLTDYVLKNYKAAIADYNKAIELDPQYAGYHYNCGNANYALGEHKAAIADYNKAIELDPQYADAYYNRGVVNYELENYKAAIADISEAKPLFAEAGNMEMVKKCEEEIARLKKLLKPKS